ncbi:MAG: hypothetical protein AVDCRST_MAG19-691, partial [uncultured Thermomicrobiales bacterium]
GPSGRRSCGKGSTSGPLRRWGRGQGVARWAVSRGRLWPGRWCRGSRPSCSPWRLSDRRGCSV